MALRRVSCFSLAVCALSARLCASHQALSCFPEQADRIADLVLDDFAALRAFALGGDVGKAHRLGIGKARMATGVS